MEKEQSTDTVKSLAECFQEIPRGSRGPLARAVLGEAPTESEARADAERAAEWRRSEERQLRVRIDAKLRQIANDLGPRYSPERTDLDCFQTYHERQGPVLQRLRALAARLPAMVDSGHGVILFGPVGTGKDHLLAWLLHQAAGRGIDCRWINGQDLYGGWRDGIGSQKSEESSLRPLVEPAVLSISDPIPPIGEPSAWNIAQLYRLLDRRYRMLRPTWVSLNATSEGDADSKLSAPVFDRLREGAEMFPCFWPSWRERKIVGTA